MRWGVTVRYVHVWFALALIALVVLVYWNRQTIYKPDIVTVKQDDKGLERNIIGLSRGTVLNEAVSNFPKLLNKLNDEKADQGDPRLIQLIRDFIIRPPSTDPYKLTDPSNSSDLSGGQTKAIDDLLKQKEHGFYVECGAFDGESRSNSLFFEKDRHWEGLLVEAGPNNYAKVLQKNRKAYTTTQPVCLGVNTYATKMSFLDIANLGTLVDDKNAEKNNNKKVEVQCLPLYSLLMALNRTRVDYFSLDVEGAELQVLKTIPFDKLDIVTMTVEYEHGLEGKEALQKYVESQGYTTAQDIVLHQSQPVFRWAHDLVFKKNTHM